MRQEAEGVCGTGLKESDMKITVTLELDNPYDLDAEEIEKDIRMGEDQIGWNYDYKIVSIDVD